MRFRLFSAVGLLAASLLAAAPAEAGNFDTIFKYGFDLAPDGPHTDAEAARFLTQATFGPSTASIARLRALGYAEWMSEQLSMPPTAARPFVEQVVAARTADGQNVNQDQRVDRWFVCGLPLARAATADELVRVVSDHRSLPGDAGAESTVEPHADPACAWRAAIERAGPDDRIVVFGSFYTVAGVMRCRGPT